MLLNIPAQSNERAINVTATTTTAINKSVTIFLFIATPLVLFMGKRFSDCQSRAIPRWQKAGDRGQEN